MSVICDPQPVSTALTKAGPAIAQRTAGVDYDSANRVAADAAQRVARHTGVTAASIHVGKVRKGDGVGYAVIVRGAGLFLEFGTVHMKARAFLLPAQRLESPGYARRLHDAVQDGIDHVGLGG